MDIKTKEERSKNMSHIRSKDTSPEVYLRTKLWQCGMRYRKNYPNITGKPDLYFPKYRTAVFVHGCFWHRHKECKNATSPKTNAGIWQKKFKSNIQRDLFVQQELKNQGIRVIVVWECSIEKDRSKNGQLAEKVAEAVKTGTLPFQEF